MEPVQPRPMTTASLRASFRAIVVLAFSQPALCFHRDCDQFGCMPMLTVGNVTRLIVMRAWEADHLPSRHVLVAAVDRVGQESFLRVLDDELEKFLAVSALELERAIFES